MKAKALTDLITELPQSQIIIELQDGQLVIATGFIIRETDANEPTIIIKAGKTAVKIKD